ncbi:hypothetical protein ONZ45_g13657 [Pleurotus djamor]|nr:hypothetical protein ONZ45_g13657 [Pleurotus djamor]
MRTTAGKKRGLAHVTTFDIDRDALDDDAVNFTATIGWTSSDGRRAFSRTLDVAPPSPPQKKARFEPPSNYNEPSVAHGTSFATFDDDIDVNPESRTEDIPTNEDYATGWMPEVDEEDCAGHENKEGPSTKGGEKKRYASSDEPLRQWVPFREEYMREILSLERLSSSSAGCARCFQRMEESATFRCTDCFGEQTMCQKCCCEAHISQPLHLVERWNGQCYEKTTLKDLGLRVQLGHPIGVTCSSPTSVSNFVVIHVNGLHVIHLDFCGCEKVKDYGLPRQQLLQRRWFPATISQPQSCATFYLLDHFSMNTLQGKVTMYDYYAALEKLTDNTLENPPPYRMKEFIRMHREYRHLWALIQGGRGHSISGINGTAHGDLTVVCPACPRPGINLPSGWDLVSGAKRYLYTLFIALDACFRLKRRLVSSVKKDPGLGVDWGYFVEREPFRKYILGVTDQKEISTCSGLAALDYANSKFSRGYAATGVCLGVCARHEFIQRNGAADLQVGERYANVDYCFASLMRHHDQRLNVVVSYDIACQWGKDAVSRLQSLPPVVRLCLGLNQMRFAIPKLHIHSHTNVCQRSFSLNYLPGVGRTDGEGIERPWANIGGTATSTRVMGPGARVETLNAHWSHWNWQKLVGLGELLKKRLKNAIEERAIQLESFQAFSVKQAAQIPVWKKMVLDYEVDSSQPNPYYVEKKGITENDVRLKFAHEDAEALSQGQLSVHDVSPSAFIREGLDLEALQRRLKVTLESKNCTTVTQELDVVDVRSRLARRLSKFRLIQSVYMPCIMPMLAVRVVPDEEEVESVPLYLPSSLTSHQQLQCTANVCNIEADFREGECQSALNDVRNGLFIKARLLGYKNRNARHQSATTRTRALITRNETKISLHAAKYQNAWKALSNLPQADQRLTRWPKLNAEDIRCMEDPETLTKRHARRERRVENGREDAIIATGEDGASKAGEGERFVPREGHRTISWIWLDSTNESGKGNSDALRVEWAKAWARVRRWTEEVELLKEEMRRTQVSLRYQASEWRGRAMTASPDGGSTTTDPGASAYAYRRARVFEGIADAFEATWKSKSNKEGDGSDSDEEEVGDDGDDERNGGGDDNDDDDVVED